MPVLKCLNGKWKIDAGIGIYNSKALADKAYAGYQAYKHISQALHLVPVWMQRLFEHRLELIKEWVEFYRQGVEEGTSDPLAYAWIKFREKWKKAKYSGRWIKKS